MRSRRQAPSGLSPNRYDVGDSLPHPILEPSCQNSRDVKSSRGHCIDDRPFEFRVGRLNGPGMGRGGIDWGNLATSRITRRLVFSMSRDLQRIVTVFENRRSGNATRGSNPFSSAGIIGDIDCTSR